MKKLLLALSAGALLIGTSAFADTKIGVLDLNKVLMESPQVTVIKTDLKKKFDPREQEIVTAQNKLKSDIEDFNKNAATMKKEAQAAAQQNILAQQKKYQELSLSFQNDLTAAQTKAMQDVFKKIEAIVNKIAANEHYDLVITKVSTAYSNPKFDITDTVIKEIKK